MYGYIKGIVKEIDSNYIVIDNHDIGYIIYVPNPYYYQINNSYTVYTYTHIREDEYSLYGFANQEALKLFLKLRIFYHLFHFHYYFPSIFPLLKYLPIVIVFL